MKKLAVIGKDSGRTALLVSVLFLVWEAASALGGISSNILPPPSAVLRTLPQIWPMLLPHVKATLQEAMAGFLLAVVLAIFVALLMDASPAIKKAAYPLVVASQTVPIICVAPLLIIWFGYGMLPKVLVVVLVCFFPVAISLLEGLAAVDPELLKLLKSMSAPRAQVYRLVKLPAALPNLFAGLKIAAAYSIMGAIIGEWLGAMRGLGYFMTLAQRSFYTERLFAAILVITLLSLLVFKIICVLEKAMLPWISVRTEEW